MKAYLEAESEGGAGRAERTLAAWETLVPEEHPLGMAGRILLARVQVRHQEAIALARKVTRFPEQPEFQSLLVLVCSHLGFAGREDYQWFVGLMDKFLEANPRHAPTLKMRAGVYETLGNDEGAGKDFESAYHANPADPEIAYDAVHLACHRGEWDAAQTWLDRAVAAGLAGHREAYCRSRIAAGRGRHEEAMELGLQAVTGAAHSVAQLNEVAEALDDLNLAGEHLQRVKDSIRRRRPPVLNPGDAYELGRTYLKFGLNSEARAVLEEWAARFPEEPRILRLRAHVIAADGDPERAIEAFTRVLEVEPNLPRAYAERGAQYMYLLMKKPKSAALALRDLTRALELGSDDKTLRLRRAALYLLGGKRDAAVRDLSAYCAWHPVAELVEVTADLAKSGYGAAVLPLLQSLYPHLAEELVRSADRAAASGDLPLAHRCYAHAVNCVPAHVPALVGLARCAARADPQAAILYLEEAARRGTIDRKAIAADPQLAPLRAFPRFSALLQE